MTAHAARRRGLLAVRGQGSDCLPVSMGHGVTVWYETLRVDVAVPQNIESRVW